VPGDATEQQAAIAEYHKAIELDPKDASAHYNLGVALYDKGQLDDAIAEYKKAIELDPKLALAHGALGQPLLARGRFAEARATTQQALDLLPENHPLRPTVLRQRSLCDAWLALEAKLPDVLAGKAKPKDIREHLGLLEVCLLQQRHADAAKLYADAFVADAKLAEDLRASHRYNAACSAALAAAGRGTDSDKLDDKERTRLRGLALEWLRADLDAWARRLEGANPEDRKLAHDKLKHWQGDTDLAGVRDPKARATLPADEQEACQKLWADVDALLKKVGDGK
jgi:tetratricopeptide (TPR) repeat protein